MRRTAVALLCLTAIACQPTPQPPAAQQQPGPRADAQPANPATEPDSRARKPVPKTVVRKDLVAEDLPAPPTLESIAATELGAGVFELAAGTNELVPRAAVSVRDGLMLVGQGYVDRQPGAPAQARRWSGFVPTSGSPRSTADEPGAIRGAIAHADGGLVIGSDGIGPAARGWFAQIGPDGTITNPVTLDSPNLTELFAVVPGQSETELAIVGGYVDAQGWLVSLDPTRAKRWEKYIGSFGYTQVRGLVRLDNHDLLAVGTRAQGFGQAWFAVAPGDGGNGPAPDDVVQDHVEIGGADPNQTLRAIVDVGVGGYVALGTAKRNYMQAHDQLLAVGFDRAGAVAWSRVVEGVRVTDVLGVRATAAGVRCLVVVPLDGTPAPATGLALVDLPSEASQPAVGHRLADTEGWSTSGFVDGRASAQVLAWRATEGGIEWRLLGPND